MVDMLTKNLFATKMW